MTSAAQGWPILKVAITEESDVVTARQRARRVAELLGFDPQDQTRIATAVSEIARNAFEYAGGGWAQFSLVDDGAPVQSLHVRIRDQGPGIAEIEAVLEGRYRSRTGMGVGLSGARRLVDGFSVDTAPGRGATVDLAKTLPRRRARLTREALAGVVAQLLRERAVNPIAVLAEQNQELMSSLDELRRRQEDLARLNQELEDTNRGVVALYAELDERAEQLRQASESKSRFLSNMSHEFRTPLNSILALSRLLLDRADGDLGEEQERQVGYIRQSAQSLSELVNDLLDLAKVEAGKIEVRPVAFTVPELFGGLRGALRPLNARDAVELVFEEPPHDVPGLVTDEAKVTQILRNFVSNALKFTPDGEVRVSARSDEASGRILFAVADTGIGIAPRDQLLVFEEFTQVDTPLQSFAKGTGLGLPLSRRLAELLHGEILVESEPGQGSVFTLSIPPVYAPEGEAEADRGAGHLGDAPGFERGLHEGSAVAQGARVLVVDDDEAFRYLLRQMIAGSEGSAYQFVEAADGLDGLRLAQADPRPDVILLDLEMPRLDGYAVLQALSSDLATRAVPVIVVTSSTITPEKALRLAPARTILSKATLSGEMVAAALTEALHTVVDRTMVRSA